MRRCVVNGNGGFSKVEQSVSKWNADSNQQSAISSEQSAIPPLGTRGGGESLPRKIYPIQRYKIYIELLHDHIHNWIVTYFLKDSRRLV